MRLWSLHPKYLDPQGLVALWRESLLAQAVLRGETRGYRNHPQLIRFKEHVTPLAAIARYLTVVHDEAITRGYNFDQRKIRSIAIESATVIDVTDGQLAHEWAHLLAKLELRNPELYERWATINAPETHPMFRLYPGEIAIWERI